MTEKARSRARIGADYARSWAREICLKNPYAKAVMLAVANYMNEDGSAYPGIGTIARDTDISEDTVVQRLRWLEKIGAIALFKCWVDENGRRNYDGRGRVTASEIRFLFEADVEEIEAAAVSDSRPQTLRGAAKQSAKASGDNEQADDAISPRHGREQTPVDESVISTGLAPDQPPPAAARTEEQEVYPPKSPPSADEADAPREPETGTPYGTFSEVYGEGSVRPEKAHHRWQALSETERQLAIRAARAYRTQRQAAKKALMDPARFLADPALWNEFASKPTADAAAMRAVPIASLEGRAVTCLWRLSGRSPFTFQSGDGPMISVKGNASPQVLALARCVDDAGRQAGQWTRVEVGSQPFGAWRELLGKAIGRPPWVRPGQSSIDVPAEFPPRADGSWPEFTEQLEKAG